MFFSRHKKKTAPHRRAVSNKAAACDPNDDSCPMCKVSAETIQQLQQKPAAAKK